MSSLFLSLLGDYPVILPRSSREHSSESSAESRKSFFFFPLHGGSHACCPRIPRRAHMAPVLLLYHGACSAKDTRPFGALTNCCKCPLPCQRPARRPPWHTARSSGAAFISCLPGARTYVYSALERHFLAVSVRPVLASFAPRWWRFQGRHRGSLL